MRDKQQQSRVEADKVQIPLEEFPCLKDYSCSEVSIARIGLKILCSVGKLMLHFFTQSEG